MAVLVAIAIAVSAFWLVSESKSARDAWSQPGVSPATTHSAEPETVGPPADETAKDAQGLSPAGNGDGDREVPHSKVDPSKLDWVQGLVQVPTNTPRDEALEVLAFAKDHDPAADASDMSSAELEQALEHDLVARAPVAGDGRYRCSVPNDRGALWLVLSGRYLHCDAGQRVELPASDAGAREHKVDFEPQLGAWVTGRVVLPSDATDEERDLGQQRIDMQFDPLRSFNTVTGVSGGRARGRHAMPSAEHTFEFRGVLAGLEYDLRLTPAHLAALKTARFATEPGAHVVVDAPLAHGGALLGLVHDDRGQPVADASIAASVDPLVFGQGGFELRKGQSAADGSFELKSVAAGKLQVRVEAEGFLQLTRDIDLADLQRVEGLDFTLSSGSAISGTVKWPDGSAADKVEIKVGFDMSQIGGMGAFNAMKGADGKAVSHADGSFEVRGLGAGPFTIKAHARAKDATGESRERDQWRARVDGVKPGTKDLALVLAEPQAVAGIVTDRDGQPITKFSVTARRATSGMIPGLDNEKISDDFTSDAGKFELFGLGTGKWEVAAVAADYAQSAGVPLTLPQASDAPPLAIALGHVARISGTVLGIDHAPAAEAEVRVKLGLQDLIRAGTEQRKPPTARTDKDGHFTLEGLTAGNISLIARADDTADSAPAVVELGEGKTVDGVVLTLREGGLLTGEIFAKDGTPLSGASVMTNTPSDPVSQRWTNADAQGHFRIEHMAPGTWNVIHLPMGARAKSNDSKPSDDPDAKPGDSAQSDAMALFADMQMATADMVDGKETHVVIGAPPKNPVHVHGRALVDGHGVANVLITFVADGGKGLDGLRFVNSGPDGSYSVQVNEPGGYLVSAQKAGTAGQQQTHSSFVRVPEVTDFEHDLALPVGGISGNVRDPSGDPAASVRVTLTTDGAVPNGALFGEQFAEISTDEHGNYELVWLKAGTYSVAVGGSAFGGLFGDSPSAHGRQIKSDLKLSEGEWMRGVDFKLREPGSIHGLVKASDGKPVAQAAIFVRDGQGRLLERLSMTQTDASGRFVCAAIEPGDYSVTARTAAEVTSAAAQVHVREKTVSEVELSLAAGTMLIVSLANEEGTTVECDISVLDEAGRQVNGMMSLEEIMTTFSQGRFSTKEQRVGPLPPGKYRVTATAKDGKSVNKPVTLSGQAERRLILRL
jgi:hypothetical protein